MSPDTFRTLRVQAGLSQSGLAALWGIHRQTVSQWERGVRPIPSLAARLLEYEAGVTPVPAS